MTKFREDPFYWAGTRLLAFGFLYLAYHVVRWIF